MEYKCNGLTGWLFGHKYQPIFDVDKEFKNPEELKKLVQAATSHNFWNTLTPIKVDTNAVKRITKTYVKHVCTRCGHYFDAKLNIDKQV